MSRPTISMGIFSDPLADQLTRQNFEFDADEAKHWQLDMEAISRLRCRGVITPSAGGKAYDKLAARIWQNVRRATPDLTDGEG